MLVETIKAKRDGGTLSSDAIGGFIDALAREEASEGQAAAFAMAVYLQGMDTRETAALTMAMANSGTVLAWDEDELGGPVVDKHSTGGIGDKVSILLAPMLAACGAYVPMVSGRGLGHTGGTLDKLEALPGYSADQPTDRFRQVVREVGCAIVGATRDLAPADRVLYAVRDQTATVESVPLITASILSKKIAAGIRRLLMDVKVGNGAFMRRQEDALALAKALVATATDAKVVCQALITDMESPLGVTAGNALEVAECIDILTGEQAGDRRLLAVTIASAAHMLQLAELVTDLDSGAALARQAIASGKAAEAFARMVAALGGPPDCLSRPRQALPQAPVQKLVSPAMAGVVATIDTRLLGEAVLALGGGRLRTGATIDHAVGLSRIAGIGSQVDPQGSALCMVHARTDAAADAAAASVLRAYGCADAAPPPADILATVP